MGLIVRFAAIIFTESLYSNKVLLVELIALYLLNF
jgi:hypothetical protein